MTQAKKGVAYKWMEAVLLILLAVFLRYIAPRTPSRVWDLTLNMLRSGIYIGLFTFWGISVYQRTFRRQTRCLLLAMAGLLIFWILIRTVKWYFFHDIPQVIRYLWYLYYTPMLLIPAIGLITALEIGTPWNAKLSPWAWFLLTAPIILAILILTNDLHQWAFLFPKFRPWNESDYDYGPLYYTCALWCLGCGLAMICILVKKCRLPQKGWRGILPLVPPILAVGYTICYVAQIPLFHDLLGDVAVVLCLLFAATVECCIETGLIRGNTRYDELFQISGLRAMIGNSEGKIILRSAHAPVLRPDQLREAAEGPIELPGGLRLSSAPIKNGRVFWAEDLYELTELLHEAEELGEYLAGRQKAAQEEYRTQRQKQQLEEQNRLNRTLLAQTEPAITQYEHWLNELEAAESPEQRQSLVLRLGLLCIYIKRRDNLVFLRESDEQIHSSEAEFCLRETFELLKVSGIETDLQSSICGKADFNSLIGLYEEFFQVVFSCLEQLRHLSAFVASQNGHLSLTLNLTCSDSARSVIITKEAIRK